MENRIVSFSELKTDFEREYILNPSSVECGNALQALSRAIAFAILKKLADPQGKSAQSKERIKAVTKNGIVSFIRVPSDNACNPYIASMKKGLVSDVKSLDILPILIEEEYFIDFNKNGDIVTKENKDVHKRLNQVFFGEVLSDGMELAQEAALAIWEESEKYSHKGIGFLEFTYTEKYLSRKVKIRKYDSAKWEDREISPIVKVFRTVRQYIHSNKSVRINPKSGHLYLEDLAVNPDNGEMAVVYWRLPKYADFGSMESGYSGNPEDIVLNAAENKRGQYTANETDALRYECIRDSLGLTDSQDELLRLREKGFGQRAIASYLGISPQAVQNRLGKIEKKARAVIGDTVVDEYKAKCGKSLQRA